MCQSDIIAFHFCAIDEKEKLQSFLGKEINTRPHSNTSISAHFYIAKQAQITH